MSVFPSHYQQPIVKKEQQQELKEQKKFDELAHKMFRPALVHVSSSLLFDPTLNKFINHIMEGGQKELARSLMQKAFQNIKRTQLERYHLAKDDEEREVIELNPRVLLHQAIENCRPIMILKNIKRGGKTYKVPVPITEKRSFFLAMKWLVEAGNDKAQTIHFPEKIAWEIIDAANNTGRVIKRKQDLHKECEANRAYAHYRWVK